MEEKLMVIEGKKRAAKGMIRFLVIAAFIHKKTGNPVPFRFNMEARSLREADAQALTCLLDARWMKALVGLDAGEIVIGKEYDVVQLGSLVDDEVLATVAQQRSHLKSM